MRPPATVFSQITAGLYTLEFARCAEQFPMPRTSRSFSAYDHFLALCFGQLTYRDSLRDIVTCLNARPRLQFHLGFRGHITRTNLAYANEHRDWRVFEAVAQVLMRRAQRLYHDESGDEDLPRVAFALDSSIIHLSLNLFPWAYYPRSKAAALKLHTLLLIRGSLPVWSTLTEATFPDMKMLDEIPVQPGAFYVMDRGYLDFGRLLRLQQQKAFFVVRSKCHVRFRVLQSRKVDKTCGLRCDQTIGLTTSWSRKSYDLPLRRIRFRDEVHLHSLVFLTNNFDLGPQVICQLYKRRWEVELFFKWIKQHLRIRNFFGRSPNAIRCQVWTAICSYLLVAIARKQLGLEKSLHEILQILSVTAFEQTPLNEVLAHDPLSSSTPNHHEAQVSLGF